MKLYDFNERFPDEHSCRMDLKRTREKAGIKCKSCAGTDLRWIASRYLWHCRSCSFRTSIRSGTIMECSNLPVRKWYLCMAIMSATKKPISAHEMKRQLDSKRYEPIWAMMHKIREAMGQRDARYSLGGIVEFDEAHFKKHAKKGLKIKKGLGSQLRQNVAVMAESTPLEDPNTGKKSSHCKYFKMKVLPDQKAATILGCVQESLDQKSIVLSDKSNRYIDIKNLVEGHISYYSDADTTTNELRWVHIAISNAKRTLLGIFHQVKWTNLQAYLNEFCYKLNRRYFGDRLFDRLCLALATSTCKKAD